MVTYDGRSFMLDGRRIWLVSGAIHYARVPEAEWADRIRAAKHAGFNAVSTPVVWSMHETRPGQFDFNGIKDLRRFVELIGEEGMYCIVNIGPYIGSGYDFGGLPAWLAEIDGVEFRTVNAPFLEATSRFIGKVANRIKDLQVSAPGKGGPIVLIELESNWVCGDEAGGAAYLGELERYLRESGLNVPVINSNNLWLEREGQIDAWSGTEDLLAVMRQLAAVRPDQPRLVVDFYTQPLLAWGTPKEPLEPWGVQRRLAEIVAGGGQFNISPFHGGTIFGFQGGRLESAMDQFVPATNDAGAPLNESGKPGVTYAAVRRLAMFASQFGRVFANLDPTYQPVLLDPNDIAAKVGRSARGSGVGVTHVNGTQGSVAFVFGPDPQSGGTRKSGSTNLLLPDGGILPVDLGSQAVAWCLFDVKLTSRCHLDYSSLNAFATLGDVFVCFGRAGSEGLISVNGSPLEVQVPKGRKPLVTNLEDLTIVVCNEEQIDQTYLTDEAVYIGVEGIDGEGRPIGSGAFKFCVAVSWKGEQSTAAVVPVLAKSSRRSPSGWLKASAEPYFAGKSPRFASIPGPATLTALGAPYGYGWYRITFRSTAVTRHKLAMPGAADRLHFYLNGEPIGVYGVGPGATTEDLMLQLDKGEQQLVVLADNLGRFASGNHIGEPKGLFDHLWEIAPFKVGKVKIETAAPTEILSFRSPIWDVRDGDVTFPERATWRFIHRKKTPIFLRIDGPPCRALLILNDQPIELIDSSGPSAVVLDYERLNRGKNTLQLVPIPDTLEVEERDGAALAKELGACSSFLEGVVCATKKASWAFAKWDPPTKAMYKPIAKAASGKGPAWWKAAFETAEPDAPAAIDLVGMTKGQLFINGRHVCRYFVATATGKAVPPQSTYKIPSSWLHEDKPNELLLFDEHGGNPAKVRVLFGPAADAG